MKGKWIVALAAILAVGALPVIAGEYDEVEEYREQREERVEVPESRLERQFRIEPQGREFRYSRPGGDRRGSGAFKTLDSWKEFYVFWKTPQSVRDRTELIASKLPRWVQPGYRKDVIAGWEEIVAVGEQNNYPYGNCPPDVASQLKSLLFKEQIQADERLFAMTFGQGAGKVVGNVRYTGKRLLQAYVVSAEIAFDTRYKDGKTVTVSGDWRYYTITYCANGALATPTIYVRTQMIPPPPPKGCEEIPAPPAEVYEIKVSAEAYAEANARATAVAQTGDVVVNVNVGGGHVPTPYISQDLRSIRTSTIRDVVTLVPQQRNSLRVGIRNTNINTNTNTNTNVNQNQNNIGIGVSNNAGGGGK